MNGFGHFAAPLLWYRTYWALVSLCLVVVAAVLWPRGTTEGLMRRIPYAACARDSTSAGDVRPRAAGSHRQRGGIEKPKN